MTEKPNQQNTAKNHVDRHVDSASPDSLMNDFRGRPLVTIIGVTVVAHAVLIGVFSFGYLKEQIFGEAAPSLSEEQRMEVALREAASSLREIAERHGVSPQELSDRFAAGSAGNRSSGSPRNPQPDEPEKPANDNELSSSDPPSEIEKELQKEKDGPELPDLPSIDDEDDLFP